MSKGRVQIPVAVLEFDDGGRALWVHDSNGMTILRLSIPKGITVSASCENLSPHADMVVVDSIEFCIPSDLQ